VALYIMLSTLSESGRKVLRERPGWIRKVNADVTRMGARHRTMPPSRASRSSSAREAAPPG